MRLAQQRDKITIVIFGPPSLGAFLPPLIKAQKFDEANNLDITFEERPPDAYVAQFNSGEFKVGGSASLMTVGLADVRGVKVSYLFNLFDFWGAVVTNKAEVKTLKDLEGRQLAAARSTTNYIMFEWLAKRQGVDVSKIAGRQHGHAGPDRLCAGRPGRRRAALGAGLHHPDLEEARHPHARRRHRRRPGRPSPAAARAFPTSALPRTRTGSSRTRR